MVDYNPAKRLKNPTVTFKLYHNNHYIRRSRIDRVLRCAFAFILTSGMVLATAAVFHNAKELQQMAQINAIQQETSYDKNGNLEHNIMVADYTYLLPNENVKKYQK